MVFHHNGDLYAVWKMSTVLGSQEKYWYPRETNEPWPYQPGYTKPKFF